MILKNKKAAMEMSVGTIVTIVLLMSVLILGLFLVRTIFTSSTENINSIDQKVKDEINGLFSEDDKAKAIIYPSRNIKIEKGSSESGFGVSIRNVDQDSGEFSYEIVHTDSSCNIPKQNAENLIVLRRVQSNIFIGGGDIMSEPSLVVFDIPDTANPCLIAYDLNIRKTGTSGIYEQIGFNVEILGR